MVVAFGRFDIDQSAALRCVQAECGQAGAGGIQRKRFGRIDHRRQRFDAVRQRGLAFGGLFPDLPRIRGQIDFVVRVIQHALLFGVQVADGVGLFVFKKGFIGADDFGVFLQPLANALAQFDQVFHAVGRQKRVAKNLLRLLANAVHPASALNQANDGPRQIKVDDDAAVLQVLAFR